MVDGVLLPDSPGQGFPPGRQNIFDSPVPVPGKAFLVNSLVSGLATNNLPITMPAKVVPGFFCPSYGELFYNRIIIQPMPLDFGSIPKDTDLTLIVFNAFFVDKTLSAITPTNLPAVSISTTPPFPPVPPPSTVYGPLESITYDVSASINGPPSINGSFLFDFLVENDITVPVIGTRVAPYPFDFTAPVAEEIVWKTNIITSYNGTEQRIRTRKAPRQSFQITSDISPDNFNRADNLFYDWRARNFGLPVFTEKRFIDSDVTAGATTINVSTLYGDFRTDGFGIIYVSPKNFEIFEIAEIFVGSLTVSAPLANSYSASVTTVAPVRVSRLDSDPMRNFTGYNGNMNCNFSANENIELATSASPVQFDGLDVMLDEPLKNGRFSTDTYMQEVNIVDYETGIVSTQQRWSNTKIPRGFRYLLSGLEDIWNFRLWLHRRAGKIRPFYMPSFENNLRLKQTGLIADTFLIENDFQQLHGSTRIHIAIKTYSSGFLFRTVLLYSITGDDLTVSVDTALSVDASDIQFISYMGQKRLASDRIEFNWLSNNVVDVTVPIIEVKP